MTTPSLAPERRYSTPELARLARVQSSTINNALYRKGSFLGLKPVAKLPNGRLLWSADEADRLVAPQPAEASQTTTHLQGGAR
jgi:hypothetical protein